MRVKFKLEPQAIEPKYQTEGSAGMDLHTCLEETVVIAPRQTAIISTGISMEIPEGVVGKIYIRSSKSLNPGICLANGTGIIDSDYRGIVQLLVENKNDSPVTIEHGERIAQIVFQQYIKMETEIAYHIDSTVRGFGGLGSTG